MTRSKFTVLIHKNPPPGFPNKYGALESLDGSFPRTVFCTKAAWKAVIKKVRLPIAEQQAREQEVLTSELVDSIAELDNLVVQSESEKHLM